MNEQQHGLAPPPVVGHVAEPERLYRLFAGKGDLVFDVGAHVGEHTAAFLRLGCRVVSVEPQRWEAQRISAAATVVCAAVRSAAGTVEFFPASGNTYCSTTERGFTLQSGYPYDPPVVVDAVTLDGLIDTYGVPVFVKIDVEGAEADVLSGLSQPLRALSFEVHDFDPGKADACIARLAELGSYSYSYSARETFELGPWPPERLDMFGDVYAVRQ